MCSAKFSVQIDDRRKITSKYANKSMGNNHTFICSNFK